MKRTIAMILMVVGALAILGAVGLLLYNYNEDEKAGESAQTILTSIRQYIDETEQEETDPFNDEMTIVQIDDQRYVGYLSLPTLDLDLPVMSSCSLSQLKLSPCRYYGSAKTNNLVIAAHNYKTHFGNIKNLKAGDAITFTDMTGATYRYQVTTVEVLPPDATSQVKDTGDDLILYTCTYSGSKRVVVRCSYS